MITMSMLNILKGAQGLTLLCMIMKNSAMPLKMMELLGMKLKSELGSIYPRVDCRGRVKARIECLRSYINNTNI